jgi:hypothetical protein
VTSRVALTVIARAAALAAACAMAAAACGRAEAPATGSAPGDASGARGAARGASTGAPRIPLITPERLTPLLPPAPDGWQRGAVRTARLDEPAPTAQAAATYTRGGMRVDVSLTDTGGDAALLDSTRRIAGTAFEQKVANGYHRGTRFAGFPAVEAWNHQDRLGEITLLVGDRFIFLATGTGLDRIETLRGLVERVDVEALRALR